MSAFQVILATSQAAIVNAPAAAIVLDHRTGSVWRAGRCLSGRRQGRSTVSFRIIAALIARGPCLHAYEDIVQSVWGCDPNGGPINPRAYMAARVAVWRPVLDAIGITVKGVWRGYDVRLAAPDLIEAKRQARKAFRDECIIRFKDRVHAGGRPRLPRAA